MIDWERWSAINRPAYIEIGQTYKDKTIISAHDNLITVYWACLRAFQVFRVVLLRYTPPPLKHGLADKLEDLLTNHQHSGAVLQLHDEHQTCRAEGWGLSEQVLGSDSSFAAAKLEVDGQSPSQSVGHKGRGRRTVEPTQWLDTLSPPRSSFVLLASACDLQKPLGAPDHQVPPEWGLHQFQHWQHQSVPQMACWSLRRSILAVQPASSSAFCLLLQVLLLAWCEAANCNWLLIICW